MNKNIKLFLVVIALTMAALACNFVTGGSSEMGLENLRMAFDEEGANPTSVYSPLDEFYAVGDLKNAPAGTVVEVKWLAVEIDGYSPGELIYEQVIDDFTDESFTGTIYFRLFNDSGWPVGDYKVDVYIDGSFVESLDFNVR